MSTALHELAALALVEGYRRRDFSPLEVAQSLLDHVARWEPQLCALYAFEPEAVLAQARASEARWLRGEPSRGADTMASTASMPETTWPNTLYWRSSEAVTSTQMKNWLPAESGSPARAMLSVPRRCLAVGENSARRLARESSDRPV